MKLLDKGNIFTLEWEILEQDYVQLVWKVAGLIFAYDGNHQSVLCLITYLTVWQMSHENFR